MDGCQNISCRDYRWWKELPYYLVWTTDGELAEKVKRVTDLLKICRDKLYNTETQIGEILDEE